MSKQRELPLVAICGRPNVGKSTLFNRLTGKARAIVHAEEGITRDRFYGTAQWEGRSFRVVDTGGIVEDPIDHVVRKMQEQVRVALGEACVIVFVVDGQQEITRIDEDVRDELFTYGKPVLLAVNKLDNDVLASHQWDFCSLGFGEPYAISASHNLGMDGLAEAIAAHLPETEPDETEAEAPAEVTRIAVIGKPNVGKSSFVNAILNEERSIVDPTPGTTRDAIDVALRWQDKDYIFIDTAGMRKKAGIKAKVEHFSVSRALRAIRRADVCLVMMDATEGISQQDKRILDYVREAGTGMVLVYTKWDLVEDKTTRLKAIGEELERKAPFLKHVPVLTLSSVTRQRLFKSFEYIDRVAEEAAKRIATPKLNDFIKRLGARVAPAMHKGKRARIYYATQAAVKPTRFLLFVNNKQLFHFAYLRHIENQLRAAYGFEGVPIHLELREKREGSR